jgi:hypothetical protein
MRREDKANKKKKEEEANERRRRRQLKEEEEARIQTARKLEDECWEEEWSKRLEEASERLKKAETKAWGAGGNWTEYDIFRHTEAYNLAQREATEARLDMDEKALELSRLMKEKRNEKLIREAARADEDATRERNRR